MNSLEISLNAISRNYQKLKRQMATADCGAVVKANGYGLGANPIAERLQTEGCQNFFVATFEEGVSLRETISQNIFIFHGVQENEVAEFRKYNLIPVLNSKWQLKLWPKDKPCALHFDTGMTRLGLDETDIDEAKNYNAILIMSHLVIAEEKSHPKNLEQLNAFKKITAQFPNAKKSLCNSYGIYLGADYHFNLARPGIALYGGNPTPHSANPMEPVVKLTVPILQINEINTSKTVGYDATYQAQKGDITATIPLGYADGILRTLSNRGSCYVDNIKVPIIGRVSMDLITVKLNALPPEKRKIGQPIEILGQNYTICDMARDAGTIEYEIITRLGNRFNRIYC